MADLEQIIQQAESAIQTVADKQSLEAIRVQYLGKKGELTGLMKQLGGMSADERPKFGQAVNVAKQKVR